MSMPQKPVGGGMVGCLRERGARRTPRTSLRYSNGGGKALVGAGRCVTGVTGGPAGPRGGDVTTSGGVRSGGRFERSGAPFDSRYHARGAAVNDPNARAGEMLAPAGRGRVILANGPA